MLSVPEVVEDLQAMKRLWVHECLRVFGDRLSDSVDYVWFVETLRKASAKFLHIDFDVLLERLLENPTDKVITIILK